MSAFPLFSGHGPRASTEVTFTPGGARASTELEQCPSELIGNCYGLAGIDKEVFLENRIYQGRSIKWMTNENHQKRGNGPLKACARRLLRTKRKTRARRDTIWLRALIASKNALKAPMEGAHKKNRKGERTIQQIRRGVSVQLAAAGLMPQALRWHWRVPIPRARAVAAASQGPRAQGQTNVYEQGRHPAELRHCSEREQDNPCDRRSRNRDDACRAFASAHRARPSLEWKPPRYWRISRHP